MNKTTNKPKNIIRDLTTFTGDGEFLFDIHDIMQELAKLKIDINPTLILDTESYYYNPATDTLYKEFKFEKNSKNYNKSSNEFNKIEIISIDELDTKLDSILPYIKYHEKGYDLVNECNKYFISNLLSSDQKFAAQNKHEYTVSNETMQRIENNKKHYDDLYKSILTYQNGLLAIKAELNDNNLKIKLPKANVHTDEFML